MKTQSILRVLRFGVWLLAGVLVLIGGDITKVQYAICWVALLIEIIAGGIYNV